MQKMGASGEDAPSKPRQGRSAALTIALLATDAYTRAILHCLNARALDARKAGAIGAAACFKTGDASLLPFKARRFAGSQAAAADAAGNALLLLVLALVDPRICRGGGCERAEAACKRGESKIWTHVTISFWM
jgi:hypothetical protein